MHRSDACAQKLAVTIREEEGEALSSIRYFAKVGEVRLLVITSRIQKRTTEFTPATQGGLALMVVKASPEEWEAQRLDLVPLDWRLEPVLVM